MTQLTEERFQEILAEKLAPLATKEQLAPLATKEQIEELARMAGRGFDDVLERLDVRDRMAVVEQKLQRIGEALHLQL